MIWYYVWRGRTSPGATTEYKAQKDECLDRMIIFREASLRRALREYVAHYHNERNHQGVGNRLLEPLSTVSSTDEPIDYREYLGGMLKFYDRATA